MRVLFDRFALDTASRQLHEAGRDVHLSPKAFDVLQVLLERRPAVVTKAELQERIWPGTFVTDANLNVLVAEVRRALQDDPVNSRFIRTAHRVGYAFCGAATEELSAASDSDSRSRSWIVWNDQTVPLKNGENVIGRDPRCDVWVEASGVSRRHARILMEGGSAVIEDLGSKNGTFVGARSISGIGRLGDGDVIRIGATELVFRTWSEQYAPETERLPRQPQVKPKDPRK